VPELATSPLGVRSMSMMSATIPAWLIMGRLGRRAGFVVRDDQFDDAGPPPWSSLTPRLFQPFAERIHRGFADAGIG
jgi:hypothetical protein